MKRFMSLCALSFALCAGMVSCEKTPDNSYEGTNYIYLSSDNTSMYGVEGESITVNVMLTTSLDEDAEINFEVKGGEGIVELEGNPVLIPAGETTASFDIKCVEEIDIAENTVLSVDLVSGPEKLAVRDPFQFTVMVVGSSSLTDEQKAIIEDYKSSTGIDLSKYIGLVDVTTLYTGTDPDTYEPLPVQTITGKTAIVLSEASVSGKPVLKMLSNPMGIQDEMYETLRTVTVDNTDFWYGEWASPSYAMLMEAISWTSESQEVFSMSLDNIVFNADMTIDFLGEIENQYGDPITAVPFDYTFSAYDRELEAIASGKLDPVNTPDWAGDCTASPYYHLNCDDITSDEYEGGNWIEPKAEISDEKLVFTFCMYRCALDSDYTRVIATYTPAE